MKRIIFIYALAALVIAGCSKNNYTPETTLHETIPGDSSAGSMAKYTGNFIKGPYGTVTGDAKIYLEDGKYVLALENITVTNGPDLHVYLSKEIQPVNFIDLGKLKSTNGNQLYDISGTPDFTVYKYALIHCQQYNHLFGSAELK
jgi:Electron transfer DM13